MIVIPHFKLYPALFLAYERLIDKIIYSLYGLTDAEIKIIEQSI